MPLNLDSAFAVPEEALKLASRRAELLASNLANADTPGYKARDINFHALMRQYSDANGGVTLQTTQPDQIAGSNDGANGQPMYRIPEQSSLDGNTVDAQEEKSAYMQNALQYEASLNFINGTIKQLRLAIKGA